MRQKVCQPFAPRVAAGLLEVSVRLQAVGAADEAAELRDVEGVLAEAQLVAEGAGDDEAGVVVRESPAQAGDEVLQLLAAGAGRLAPHRVDDALGGHQAVRAEQQHRQDEPLAGPAQPDDGAGVTDDLERPEHTKKHTPLIPDRCLPVRFARRPDVIGHRRPASHPPLSGVTRAGGPGGAAGRSGRGGPRGGRRSVVVRTPRSPTPLTSG